MKAFGCLCYVNTNSQGRDKFTPLAQSCISIGHPFGQKSYKILNLESKQFFVSRMLSFWKIHFPWSLWSFLQHPFLQIFTSCSTKFCWSIIFLFNWFTSVKWLIFIRCSISQKINLIKTTTFSFTRLYLQQYHYKYNSYVLSYPHKSLYFWQCSIL